MSRQLIQTLALGATAAAGVGAAEAAPANATYTDHVSMRVADSQKDPRLLWVCSG